MKTYPLTYEQRKLALCIRGARECSRNSWQGNPSAAHKREYLRLKRESMADAREWAGKAETAARFDIDMQVVAWARGHDWFSSWEHNANGYIGIWATENGKLHPWPFMNYAELRAWAGY